MLKQVISPPVADGYDEQAALAESARLDALGRLMRNLSDFPAYVPEDQDPGILVRGRWLERGGSAWIISTAGTGKSIHAVQLAISFAAGEEFSGFTPMRKMRTLVVQSEDSATRVVIDREDIITFLAQSTGDETRWREAAKRVTFLDANGKSGVEFVSLLDKVLVLAESESDPFDMVIINPFLAVLGGPVTDGGYVTPFLRGGDINRVHTQGLQAVLEHRRIGALIYHHTPKPPNGKELDGWMKSPMPEYQGAGSSDITNWGRSFVTMMRCTTNHRLVSLVAGKNGYGLKWPQNNLSQHQLIMAWAGGRGIDGGDLHAWRIATEAEADEANGVVRDPTAEDADALAEVLRQDPMTQKMLVERWNGHKLPPKFDEMTRGRLSSAIKAISADPESFGLSIMTANTSGRGRQPTYYGAGEALEMAVRQCEEYYRQSAYC